MLPVTIVTPSYNQGKFLEATIQSVLRQDYAYLQYLIIDGGSTDETLDILRRYEGRLTWISEGDQGQSDALNKGFQRADGEVVAWLNSDDVYAPGAIRKAVRFLEQNPDTAMVYGDADYIDSAGEVITAYPTQRFDLKDLALSCFVCQPTVFMRRRALADVGWLDPALCFTMDYDLWIRLARKYPVAYLPEKLALYRTYASNKTLSGRERPCIEAMRTAKKHFGYVPYSWCFGLVHSYFNRGKQPFDASPIRPLAQRLGLALFLAHNLTCSRGLRHVYDHLAGRVTARWPDGWVSREFQAPMSLEPGDRFVEFHGQHLVSQSPLMLDVYYNGTLWDQIVIRSPGSFVVSVEVPEKGVEEGAATILLRTKTVGWLPRDWRSVSFLLDDVLIFQDQGGEAKPRRPVGLRPTRDILVERAQSRRTVGEAA